MRGCLPDNMYSLQDWCTIVGMLYSQLKARCISYDEYVGYIDSMGIST